MKNIKSILKKIKNFVLKHLETISSWQQKHISWIIVSLVVVRIYEELVYDLEPASLYGIFNIVFSVIATLYIAPVIAIYRLYPESNVLIREYIKDQKLQYKIVRIAILVIIGFNSQLLSYPITFVLSLELFYISLLLNYLVTGKLSDKALERFTKLIGKHSNLIEVIEQIKSIKKKLTWLSEETLFDVFKMQTIYFRPIKPVSVNDQRFKQFLEHVKNELDPDEENKEISTSQYYFNIEVYHSTCGKALFVAIFHNSDKNLKDKKDEFNKKIHQCFNTIPPEERETVDAFENYINNFKLNILYIIEQNNFPKFKEELDQIIFILEKTKEVKPLYTDINRLILSLKDVVSVTKLEQHKLLKGKLFEFCISLFETCVYSKNNQYMENMFCLIIECFKFHLFKGCVDDISDLETLEWRITSAINFGEPTDIFFTSYINTLNQLVKENLEVSKDDKQFDKFNFAVSLLNNLLDDLQSNKVHHLTSKLKFVVIQHLQKTLIFLAALLLDRDKTSNKTTDYNKTTDSGATIFLNKIQDDCLMENLYELFCYRPLEFNPLYLPPRLHELKPDRHGFLPPHIIGSYDFVEFYANFLKQYIMKCNPEFLKKAKDEIHKYYKLKPLFKSLLEKIDKKDNTNRNIVSEIIKLCDDIEKETIIKANLSEDKIEKFVNDLHESYENVERLSKYCKPNCKTQDIKHFLKMKEKKIVPDRRIVSRKEYFIDDSILNKSYHNSNNNGRNIGQYENRAIFNQLYKKINNNKSQYRKLNRDDFEKANILSKWKEKSGSYIILTNDYSYNFSNVQKRSDIRYIGWNKRMDPICFYMLIKKYGIHLDFALWDQDPYYKEHELKHHKNISYKITDLAEDDKCRRYIAEKPSFLNLNEDGLKRWVLITLYLCPEVNIERSNFSNIELVELTNPQT